MEKKDGEIDYSECSLADLRDVEAHIDPQQNPRNYANLQRAIANSTETQDPTAETEMRSKYSSIWQRLGAKMLDILIFMPILAIGIWASDQSRLFAVYFVAPSIMFNLWYNVYLVKRYGGTPGKLTMDLRITTVEGSSAGYKEAMLRYSVLFVLATASQVALLQATVGMTDAEYFALDWMERASRMQELAPSWFDTTRLITNIWLVSQLVVMLGNSKRRAVHDFIAGTVVVRTP